MTGVFRNSFKVLFRFLGTPVSYTEKKPDPYCLAISYANWVIIDMKGQTFVLTL